MDISPSDSRIIGELSQNKVTPADHIRYVVQKYGHFFLLFSCADIFETKGYISFLAKVNSGLLFHPAHFF